jgi:hypothetical protein
MKVYIALNIELLDFLRLSKFNVKIWYIFSVDYASMYSKQYDNSPRFTEGHDYGYDEPVVPQKKPVQL